MTYQPPPGNGSQPPQPTYPRVPTAAPQAVNPPPGYYPPPASGPPILRALQGQLQNPVPILVAAVGLMLVALSFFLPLAGYNFEGGGDPLQDTYYLPDRDRDLYLSLEQQPVVIPLLLTVAITVAMSGSRRWLLFGRLAGFGLGCIGAAAALGAAFTWQRDMRELISGSSDYREDMSGDEQSEATARILENTNIGFGAGVWVLVAGIIVLVVAVMLIKTRAPGPYAVPPHGGYPQPVAAVAPASPQPYPTAAPPPRAEPDVSGARDIAVHDDPPSLSIYKPPKKNA